MAQPVPARRDISGLLDQSSGSSPGTKAIGKLSNRNSRDSCADCHEIISDAQNMEPAAESRAVMSLSVSPKSVEFLNIAIGNPRCGLRAFQAALPDNTSPNSSQVLPVHRMSWSCRIGWKLVGLLLMRMPGNSDPTSTFVRLVA